jgi:hypothetical protein
MQTAFSLPETNALLSRTPSTLNTFLRGLPSRWVAANEGFDSWSAFDIVGHLVIGERTDWMPHAKRILEHGEASRNRNTRRDLSALPNPYGQPWVGLV